MGDIFLQSAKLCSLYTQFYKQIYSKQTEVIFSEMSN